jgi:SAM-dependent methyltransferase
MEHDIYLKMREIEDTHWWFAARRSIIESVIASLKLPPGARILDMGSGTGGNLSLLSRFGVVTGIESDDTALMLSLSRKVAPVLKGCLPDNLPCCNETFDLIVMLDVLEHVDDDRSAMKALARLLAPDGFFVATVPAFPCLWGDHDIQHHHKRRYRYSMLNTVCCEAGLKILHMTYYNTVLFPIIFAVRLFRRLKPAAVTGRDVRLPSSVINTILKSLFASERHLIGRMRLPFGASILVIAAKGAPRNVSEMNT